MKKINHYLNQLKQKVKGLADEIAGRKRVEVRANTLTERAAILDAMGDALIMADMEGKVIAVNPAYEKMTGYDMRELVGTDSTDLVQKLYRSKDYEFGMAQLRTVLEGKVPAPSTITIVRKDGREIAITFTIAIIKDEEGKPTHVVITHKDVTEHILLQEMEKEAAAMKMAMDTINAIGDGVILIDMEGKITCVNPAWEKLTGYDSSEVIGKYAADVAQRAHKPEDAKKLIAALRTAMNGEVPDSFVYTLIRKKGQEIPVTYTPSFIRDAKGKPTQLVGTVKDLTEVKKAEEMLKENEEKYRMLVNTSVDGVISVDQQMNITLCNPGVERIFGHTEKDMQGQSLMKIVPERYRKAIEKGFAEFRKTGSGPVIGKTLEIEGLRKGGTEVPIELSVSSRKAGETYIATAIMRDITERKRAEEELKKKTEELKEAYRVKENFLQETSHRIITPVSIIGGNADLLLESRNLDEDEKARIRTIRERNEEIQKLVRDALLGNHLKEEKEGGDG